MRVCVDLSSDVESNVIAVYPALGEVEALLPPPEAVVALVPRAQAFTAVLLPRVTQIVTPPERMMVQAFGPAIPEVLASTGQGPPGPPGPSSDTIECIAGAALGGQRVVKPVSGGKVNYATIDNVADGNLIIGITEHAAVEDDTIVVRTAGYMTEPSWNWTLGQVYCGTNGLLTQTPPTYGFLCRVARATAPDTILVGVEEAITLI